MDLADEIMVKAEQQNIERYERLIMKSRLHIMAIADKYKSNVHEVITNPQDAMHYEGVSE
jgi:hypothetical protein